MLSSSWKYEGTSRGRASAFECDSNETTLDSSFVFLCVLGIVHVICTLSSLAVGGWIGVGSSNAPLVSRCCLFF